MERLLLMFIVIGNAISFRHALPYQEINLEDVDNSKKNYSIIILLEDELENSKASAPKKSGRTIHETAWSKESEDSERNIVVKETDKTNSTNSTNSWNMSQILKLILNYVHNQEEKGTGEVVKSGKDSKESENKSKKSQSHKPTARASKSESGIQKKYDANFKSNSYTNYPFSQPFVQKKQSKNFSKDKDTEKSNQFDAFSSLRVDDETFLENQYLNDESIAEESKKDELIDDYYDDNGDYDDDDDYCDYYSSSNSSEKAAIPKLLLKEKAEDSYEMGEVEVSDEDYLNINSETTKKLASEILMRDSSYSSVKPNESKIQKTTYQSREESIDAAKLSNEMSTNDEERTIKKIREPYPIPDNIPNESKNEDIIEQSKYDFTEQPLTVNELVIEEERYPTETFQTTSFTKGIENKDIEDDNELDILSNFRSSELNIPQIKSISQEQSKTLSTTDDRVFLQEPEATYVTNGYKPLMKTTTIREVTYQSLTTNQMPLQLTTPSIPSTTAYSTKNTKFQSERKNQLVEENKLQEISLNSLSTSNTISKQSSLGEDLLTTTKSTDSSETRKHETKNSEFQARNYAVNTQETNEDTPLSLPLSPSGEFISYTSEKEQLSNISEKNQQLSNTSEKDQQISNTSENNQQISNTSENNQQLSNSSEKDQQLSKIYKISNASEKDQQLSNTSEKDQQLSNTSEKDQQISNTSENNQQLSNSSEKYQQLSKTYDLSNASEKEQQLTNTSEKDQKISNTSEKDQQISNTSENNQQLSNSSEKDQKLSKTSEKNHQFSDTSVKDMQLSSTSEKDLQLSDFSESNRQLSNNSEKNQQLSNIFENDAQIILLEMDSKTTNLEQKEVFENKQKKNQPENSSLTYIHTAPTKKQENVDGTSQTINNADFNKPQEIITINNKNDDNMNINQNGDSVLVDEGSKRFSSTSVTSGKSSKHLEEKENDEDYYEFDVGTSVKSVSENNQISKSVKTFPTTKESDESNIIQPSKPRKPYNTILEFLYKNSNSSFIQSLKEY